MFRIKGFVIFVLITLLMFSSCKKESVCLTVWVDEGNVELSKSRLEKFAELNKKYASFNFNIIEQSSAKCRNVLLSGSIEEPDIFVFVDNQFNELMDNDYLKEVTYNKDYVITSCGGLETGIIKASMHEDKLYAYPVLNSNGYFLYYNKAYLNENDVKSFEKMADKALSAGKYVTMDLQNGWYLYSFFKAAGLDIEMNTDGISNTCNWNCTKSEIKGIDVAKAIHTLAHLPGFKSVSDSSFIQLIEDDEIVAGVNGAWNSIRVQELWGDNYAACKLPTLNIAGRDLQLHSYAGYKMLGISPRTSFPEWAEKVADWLTNDESQFMIFENTGECPANLRVAHSEAVKSSPALSALMEQSKYSHRQNVYKSVWKPAKLFGHTLTESKLEDIDLQDELDDLVEEISGKSE